MISTKQENQETFVSAEDDFTIFLGINDEIANKLYNEGILRYTALAATPTVTLMRMTAGMHTTYLKSWPEQARVLLDTNATYLRDVQFQLKTKTGAYRNFDCG
ncbi:MAG: Unknown protein [uncultured Thiotrichaceae bacterium]|uniref:Uncharacterized protein n=1 Tax=uncultured Thiotrichaceae bacterium TaxID=298394 RepID=A0A6S6TP99_9GAMM|nr:MAG: Unknown protein [uncultured Thiotrichaceae bacterium]